MPHWDFRMQRSKGSDALSPVYSQMSFTRSSTRQTNDTFLRIGWLLCFGLCLFLISWLAYAKPPFQKVYLVSTAPSPSITDDVREAMQKFPGYDCLTIAREFREPDSEEYRHQTIDPNGPVYAYYNWSEPMEKFQISLQRNITTPSDCRIVFKVLNGELYRDVVSLCDRRIRGKPYLKDRLAGTIELLLLTLSVYDIPDVDFVINVDDAVDFVKRRGRDLPIISYSMRLATPPEGLRYSAFKAPTVGFTMPSFGVYWDSLGKQQMSYFEACLNIAYPPSQRIPKAVWMGSSTGTRFQTVNDIFRNRRVSAAYLSTMAPNILNLNINSHVQIVIPNSHSYHTSYASQKGGRRKEIKQALKVMAPTHKVIQMDDFNRFAAVVDMDGNGWSDRLPKLLMSNTPVLKQEYKAWTEYFGHQLTEDHVRFFKEDLSDLLSVAESTIQLWKERRNEWDALNQGALEFAKEHVSHTGIFRAMAYSLVKYASFITWKVEMEDGYELLPKTLCCQWAWGMPEEFIPRVMYPSH